MLRNLMIGAAALSLAACSNLPWERGDTADMTSTADQAELAVDAEKDMPAISEPEDKTRTAEIPQETDFSAVLSHPDRPAEDAELDAVRKPIEVLSHSGLRAGMTAIDMEAGGGYYTELISRAVGPTGTVYMQNPAAFRAFAGEAIDARQADNRLANVTYLESMFDDLSGVADGEADLVTWVLGPHELWYLPEGVGSLGDPNTAFGEIARVLKPGGTFLVVDHAAPAGTSSASGNKLHRIDPALIRYHAKQAGLELAGEDDALANPDDPMNIGVFDESIRRKTNRFIHKYVKP